MRSNLLRPKSLRSRLFRDTVSALVLTSALYIGVLSTIFRSGSEALVRDGLWGQAEDIVDALSFKPDGDVAIALHEPMRWGYDAFFQNLKYRVLDASGNVILSSESTTSALTRAGEPPRLQKDFFVVDAGGYKLHVATYPVNTQIGWIYVQTARSDRFFDIASEAILPVVVETSSAMGLTALALFGAVILFSLRKALGPVNEASEQARSITTQTLSKRIATADIPREILPLVDAFNRSLTRIEHGFSAQQRFIANAAHELKTPLAILRGNVELDISEVQHGPLLREIDHMARIVAQLLLLAEASDVGSYRYAATRLASVVEKAIIQVSPLAATKSVSLTVRDGCDGHVLADKSALQVALRNLLENAIKFSPEHGTVEVRIAGDTVSIADHGPGIDEHHLPLLWERFWQEDQSTEGSGLGLAIVREIVDAHGGEISAANHSDGAGAVFKLRLPRA